MLQTDSFIPLNVQNINAHSDLAENLEAIEEAVHEENLELIGILLTEDFSDVFADDELAVVA